MLCDTVCLGCAFALVVEGVPPADTSALVINLYVAAMFVAIFLFTVTLWCARLAPDGSYPPPA